MNHFNGIAFILSGRYIIVLKVNSASIKSANITNLTVSLIFNKKYRIKVIDIKNASGTPGMILKLNGVNTSLLATSSTCWELTVLEQISVKNNKVILAEYFL